MLINRQKALTELGIPEALYDELLRDFVAQSAPAVIDLIGAVQSRDLEKTARTAHFIKGSSGNLRIDEIYLLAKDIEFRAKVDKDLTNAAESAEKLKAAFEQLKKLTGENQ